MSQIISELQMLSLTCHQLRTVSLRHVDEHLHGLCVPFVDIMLFHGATRLGKTSEVFIEYPSISQIVTYILRSDLLYGFSHTLIHPRTMSDILPDNESFCAFHSLCTHTLVCP